MSDSAPVPTAVTFNTVSRLVTATFDKPLKPPVIATANWLLRRAGQGYLPTADPTVLGAVVTFTASAFGGAAPPGNELDYLAAPPDLLGLDDTPVAAFTTAYVDV